MYADADADRDGYLIWLEIKAFQRMLRNRFKYLTNSLEIVGGRSGAMQKNWQLKHLYTPEEIYGKQM